jgi:hypothetical protein
LPVRQLVRGAVAVAAAITALSAMAVGQAQAATHPAAGAKHVLERGMYVIRFDAAIAKAHGYKIITYPDGDQQSVPINPKSGLPKGPLLVKDTVQNGKLRPDTNSDSDSVAGDCGVSWIETTQVSTAHVNMQSGFTSDDPYIDFNWEVELTDENGSSYQSNSSASFQSGDEYYWTGDWDDLYQYTWTSDTVQTASSYAILVDGSVCYSAGPWVYLTGLG